MSYINQDISTWIELVFILFSILFLLLSLIALSKFIHTLEQSDKKKFRRILIFPNRHIPFEINLDPFQFISIFFQFKDKNKLLLRYKITFISFLFLALLFFAISFFYF